MRHSVHRDKVSPFRVTKPLFTVPLLLGIGIGCGSAKDDRFSAETFDEYSEPLRNATIGEGNQIIEIGPDGEVVSTASSQSFTAPAVNDAGGVDASPPPVTGAGGAGGSSGKSTTTVGTGGVGTTVTTTTGFGGSFSGTGGSFGGSFGDGGVQEFGPDGFWRFDDCSPGSHFLVDSSGHGFSAQHELKGSCVPGISGLGVKFASAKDIVQVPDEPQFTVGSRVAVAAWVNPTIINKDHPIVLKRLNNTTSFSLGIHNSNIEMAVQLSNGHTFISRAPIEAKTWTHVAGMYDGRFVFLFMNGEQVGQVAAAGTLKNVFAPLRIGATTQSQSFTGVIDDVWVSTNVVSKGELTALSCIHKPMSVGVTPPSSGPVPPGTTVGYDVTVKNNDIGACQPAEYEMFVDTSSPIGGGFGGGFGATVSTTIGTGSSSTTGFGGSSTTGFGGSSTTGFGGGSGGFGGGSGGGGAGGGIVSNAGITAFVNPSFIFPVNPGATANFHADVSGSEDADPGIHHLPFTVFSFGQNFDQFRGELLYELTEPTGCFVRTRRELMVTNTSVVDDPVRTNFGPTNSPSRGVWTFGRLMRDMAPSPADAPAMTERLFHTWLTDQVVNGFTVPARPAIQQVLLDNWPRTPDGALDLDRSPLRLQAIVNRLDLRNLAAGNAGEGRFVFGVLGPFQSVQQFTVILEYKLPASTEQDVQDWANRWHALSTHPFPSEEYNAALEDITLRFSGRNAAPNRVNGSALSQLRTNEIALSFEWELREFALSPSSKSLEETTVKLTPDLGFNGTATLADFVNQNQASIIAETHTVPEQFEGQNFLAGSVFNDLIFWSAPGINDEARFHLSLNTCNGCHGPETNTTFLQITPRFSPGQEAILSPFLTGTTVIDPFSGQQRTLNDLSRRNADLKAIVCGVPLSPVKSPAGTPAGSRGASLAKGLSRVH